MHNASRFYDVALDMLGIAGFDGYFKELNPAWERTLGYTLEELLAQPYLTFVHPDDRAATAAEAARMAAGKNSIAFENRYRCKDGTYKWLSWTTKPDVASQLAYIVARDVTAQKATEAALQRYAGMVAASEDLMAYIDRDFHYQAVNPTFLRYWQKSAEELLGSSVKDLLGEELFQAGVQAKLEQCMTGATIRHQGWFTFPQLGKRFLDIAYYPTYAVGPEPTGVVISTRDITARHTSEAIFRHVLETAIDGFWIADLNGRLLEVNQALCSMLGYDRAELLALNIADLEAAESPAEVVGHMQQIAARGADRFATRHRRKDGQVIDVEVSSQFDSTGHGRLVVFTHDITERIQVERQQQSWINQIEESNQALQQFAYVASHDLQEPLRMVTSYLGLLERRYANQLDDEAHEFIGFAVDGAKRMQTLIRDLLAYSRISTRGQEFMPTDSQTALNHALQNLKVAIADGQATITQDPMPMVLADQMQLIQLFQNLIGNAIKYRCNEPSQVHIGAKQDGLEWQFSVCDNGIGIDARYFTRIFEIFQQLHNRDEYPGTGIGLAICKKIVERHGGRLWLASQPGEGSSFFFTLPAAA